GDRVLEIGCGTGQLTRQLLAYRFALTAIDISPDMVAVARTHPGMGQVQIVATAFEDFDAADSTYGLIASATAFHWVDPDIGLAKAARRSATTRRRVRRSATSWSNCFAARPR